MLLLVSVRALAAAILGDCGGEGENYFADNAAKECVRAAQLGRAFLRRGRASRAHADKPQRGAADVAGYGGLWARFGCVWLFVIEAHEVWADVCLPLSGFCTLCFCSLTQVMERLV